MRRIAYARVWRQQAGWATETSSGEFTEHLTKSDAVQSAILWAYLNRPADVFLAEGDRTVEFARYVA